MEEKQPTACRRHSLLGTRHRETLKLSATTTSTMDKFVVHSNCNNFSASLTEERFQILLSSTDPIEKPVDLSAQIRVLQLEIDKASACVNIGASNVQAADASAGVDLEVADGYIARKRRLAAELIQATKLLNTATKALVDTQRGVQWFLKNDTEHQNIRTAQSWKTLHFTSKHAWRTT